MGYHEERSAALLADSLHAAGFQVERGIVGIPTAFIATIGAGKPVIAILGEYDALPGLAQENVAERKQRSGPAAGHGCGHHLFGVASASACIALAEQFRAGTIKGTLRYYGCPAEEGGSAKAFLVRAGRFNDCDAVLHWHPASQNSAGDESSHGQDQPPNFGFRGKKVHAAGAPEQGRSALDAVELTNHAAELLREHTPDFTRIHHIITAGGNAPNVVPDFAEAFYYIRHPKADVVRKFSTYKRLLRDVRPGRAVSATETELETEYLGGIVEIMPNDTLGRVARANLERLNDLQYDDVETTFATKIRPTLDEPLPLERPRCARRRPSQGLGRQGFGRTWATSPGSRPRPASPPPAGYRARRPTRGKPSPPAAPASAAKE